MKRPPTASPCAIALVALTLASASVAASTFSCVESTSPSGGSPRTLELNLDFAADTAFVETRAGRAKGILQTTMDLYVSRLETAQGKVFLLSLNRHNGGLAVVVEAPIEQSEKKPEFRGYCTAQ